MLDVAKRAGVSISSVSRVTNNYPGVHPQLRAQVESALKDLNYLPSFDKRRLQHPRTRIIYFLLANRDLNIPFHSRVLQSIEKECSRQGDLLLFRTLRYTPQMAPEDLNIPQLLQLPLSDKKRGFPDGVILTGITSPNLRQALKDAGLPVLLLGNNYSGTDLEGDAVTFDGFQGAFDATRHLIDLGHTNILYIGDPKLSWFSNLFEGYLHALREAGLKPITQNKGLSDSFYSNGYLSVDLMFQEATEITAIFAGYDDTALGAWKALNDRNLQVPRDVSLVGFDDEDYAAFTVPPLTTVRIDVETVGRELISQLYRKLQTPSATLPVVKLTTTLVKRGTCWPVRVLKKSAK
jgi:LacI family transcriptional regulator